MKAKKSYGQHFLVNEGIAQDIANSLTLDGYNKVLEVGPGQGMLTKYLINQSYDLLVSEADKDMINYLQQNYPELKESILPGNFLRVPLEQIYPNTSFAIIGNFPYNISSQIVFKMLDHVEQVPEMVGMFQKEMAERIIAEPGSKTFGVISVFAQVAYEGEYLFTVAPEEFNPPPRVQSAVIRLKRKENYQLDCDEKLFKRIVKTAFSQRRKMLRSTMKAIIGKDDLLKDDFFSRRPESLSVQEFVDLTKLIQNRK